MRETREDFFGHRHEIEFTPYEGLDYSKSCFVFPGQSAATPGMGAEDYRRFSAIQHRFKIADQLAETLKIAEPSLYILNPEKIPASELSLVRNLALFTMSLGLFEVLIASGEKPSLITSHSFGEFAAFVAAGVLSFEDGFRLVYERERACPNPNDAGGMIAVSASAEAIRAQLDLDHGYFANVNSPRQTVLAVPTALLKDISAELKRKRLPNKILSSIPQPYHSPLLEKSAAAFADAVRNSGIAFHAPKVPLFSSVTCERLSPDDFPATKAFDILIRQLVTPVDFIAQVERISSLGVITFVELGQNAICSPWIADILEGKPHRIRVPRILQAETNRPARQGKNYDSKLVGFLNRVISTVTGYSVDEISLSKNFQEDLGIDSIKKAQIILSFIESQGESANDLQNGMIMNQIRTIEDVLAWYLDAKGDSLSVDNSSRFALYQGRWVESQRQAADADFAALENKFQWVSAQKMNFVPAPATNGIIFFDDGSPFDFHRFAKLCREQYARLGRSAGISRLGLVVTPETQVQLSALSGFFHSLAKEIGTSFKTIYLTYANSENDRAQIELEMAVPRVDAVRLSPGRREILDYQEVSAPKNTVPAHETISAIGGASGITLELLKGLIRAGTKAVHILGRRQEADVAENLDKLRALGGEIHYSSGDASNRADLERFLDGHRSDLVIHAAGIEKSALLPEQTASDVEEQVRVKLDVMRHLIDRRDLPPLICFGSTAGEFGSPGQTIYSYTNKAMSLLSEELNQKGKSVQVIDWPPWDNIGMTEKPEIYRHFVLSKQNMLSAEDGRAVFMALLNSAPAPHWVCLDGKARAQLENFSVHEESVRKVFPSGLRSPIRLENWNSLKIPALRDHGIMGQPVIPVSLSIATLWHLGYFMKNTPIKITDAEAASFMVLHRRDSPYLLEYKREAHRLHCEVRSNQTHFQGFIENLKREDLNFPPLLEPKAVKNIDMKRQSYGRFGPRLHLLENVTVDQLDRAFAEVDCNKHDLYPGCASLNRQVILLEALFHLSGACSEFKTGRLSVPMSFVKAVLFESKPGNGRYRLVAKCNYFSADILEADLYAYNERGEVAVAVLGERLRLFGEGR